MLVPCEPFSFTVSVSAVVLQRLILLIFACHEMDIFPFFLLLDFAKKVNCVSRCGFLPIAVRHASLMISADLMKR